MSDQSGFPAMLRAGGSWAARGVLRRAETVSVRRLSDGHGPRLRNAKRLKAALGGRRPERQWCAKQVAALAFAMEDESFYLCGRAGTGKTALITAIVERLRSEGKVVAVTAMTGAAACLLGDDGRTMHSWAGIRLAKGEADKLVKRMSERARRRWKNTDLLIIDECSMLSSELLDRLDGVARYVRRRGGLFGGLQVMLVGDLHQLSPVEGKLLCHSPVFTRIAVNRVLLTTIFRQSDPRTLKVLDEVRTGRLSKTTVSYLRSLADTPLDEDKKTVLTALKKAAAKVNAEKLEALPGEGWVYSARDHWEETEEKRASKKTKKTQKKTKKTKKTPSLSFTKELHLKVGARVMHLKNNGESGDDRLVNGSTGVVVDFCDTASDEPMPRVRWDATGTTSLVTWVTEQKEDDKGNVIFTREQLPLQLGWALTIHKAQGMTLEQVEIDLHGCFAAGQAYVALSRCKDLSKVRLLNFSPRAVITDPNASSLDRAMQGLPLRVRARRQRRMRVRAQAGSRLRRARMMLQTPVGFVQR